MRSGRSCVVDVGQYLRRRVLVTVGAQPSCQRVAQSVAQSVAQRFTQSVPKIATVEGKYVSARCVERSVAQIVTQTATVKGKYVSVRSGEIIKRE
jgi:hypothetical protein